VDPHWRRVVGPYRTVLMVLTYLRHTLSQSLVAELFSCSHAGPKNIVLVHGAFVDGSG
jgi:hypothetical protein